ncbi:hypothetical protein COCON_G00140040 [Conger conger]|uniref:TNFR-Cys domain-containing protein n=1 Tax=Conger conger TaxID=82655 RepID=A0A9Q1HVI3_CONCO|nr:hypothetical protein COCON_G00140040 [Conger conger]
MEFCRRIWYTLTVIYLFNLVDFVWSRRCSDQPECKEGVFTEQCQCVPCSPDKYRTVRSNHARCEFCTQACDAERHLVQIRDCTAHINRECHCDRGYFCQSTAQYTCRRCLPCPDGTFLSTTSRRESCHRHTDCGRQGMALISTGNSTHDHVCARLTTNPTPKETTVPPSTVSTKTTKIAQTVTHDHSLLGEEDLSTGPKASPLGQPVSHNFLTGALILMFIILALLLGFFQCYKTSAFRKKCLPVVKNAKQEQWGPWKDPASLKHLVSEGNPSPSVLHPLISKKGEGLDGLKTGPGGLQQVTVDQSRGRENVNNTVGSIFIYSPRTVILGNGASEQQGEAGEQPPPQEEAKTPEEEGPAFTNAPQQESLGENRRPVFQDRGLQGCVQEAEKLRYPIPATGK